MKKDRSEYMRAYQAKNRSKINEQRKSQVKNKIWTNSNSRILEVAKKYGFTPEKTKELVGCSPQQLKAHLEAQFRDGMAWDNYGQWVIDHIRPIASFDIYEKSERLECFNFRNTQPLWKDENRDKADKTDWCLEDFLRRKENGEIEEPGNGIEFPELVEEEVPF